MAKERLPDALWARIAPVIPPKPKGGRPRVSDRAALTAILFVLRTRPPWVYTCPPRWSVAVACAGDGCALISLRFLG